ncbi:MAG TPA: MaoC/PaaZ C-terminal domain-containing protein [Beijerinckiaceae bacterium]|jgi:acyl dehydratase|nr:MaoC/PaaZ C-terminal domain-containing protein [Beijerinckiaceae bacterium]
MTNALPQAGTRLPERNVGPFSGGDLRAYAEISGDNNPLHLDAELAQSVGLAAPPVHGMLLFAAFEPILNDWRPDLRIERLSGRFTQPVPSGEAVSLSGRVMRVSGGDKPRILLRLMANGASRAPAIVGEAVLVPREAA